MLPERRGLPTHAREVGLTQRDNREAPTRFSSAPPKPQCGHTQHTTTRGAIGRVEEEAREKIQEAVKEGRRVADEISERAREEARESIEKSKQMIQLEIEKARVQIKEDVIKIAMEASELAIRERLDEDKHRNLVNHFIEELNSQN